MTRALTRLAIVALSTAAMAGPAFAHGRKKYGVPEIDAMQGAAALAVVVATLFLLRELWIRRKLRVQA